MKQPLKINQKNKVLRYAAKSMSRMHSGEEGDMVKDIKGRDISNNIVEVTWTADIYSSKPSRDDQEDSLFFLCNEFFRDSCSFSSMVPSCLSAKVNGKYFGWQKISLDQLDKELYRPAKQKTDVEGPVSEGVNRYAISEAGFYDRRMAQNVWIRFVQNREDFLANADAAYRLSHGIRCLLLKDMGFEFCGKRIIPDKEQDSYGLKIVNPGIEVWAHPHGLVITIKTSDNLDYFYDIALFAKFRETMMSFYSGNMRSNNGSYSYKEGVMPENGGVLAKYSSVNIRFLRRLTGNSKVIPHWGHGEKGIDDIWLWGYNEFAQYPVGSDGWEKANGKIHADARVLAEKHPLLKQICCDAFQKGGIESCNG